MDFEVENVEDVVSTLTAGDVQVEPIRLDQHANKYFKFFRDPDNLPIEIYEG